VLVVLRFAVESGDVAGRGSDNAEEEFVRAAHTALEALAATTGYLRGQLARAYDDPSVWCLVTEWASVGAYRRALGSYDVKVRATPLLARARPEESAFEPLATAEPGQPVTTVGSDRSGIPSRP
jgi:heme oxygenase (mycobilin-producing)